MMMRRVISHDEISRALEGGSKQHPHSLASSECAEFTNQVASFDNIASGDTSNSSARSSQSEGTPSPPPMTEPAPHLNDQLHQQPQSQPHEEHEGQSSSSSSSSSPSSNASQLSREPGPLSSLTTSDALVVASITAQQKGVGAVDKGAAEGDSPEFTHTSSDELDDGAKVCESSSPSSSSPSHQPGTPGRLPSVASCDAIAALAGMQQGTTPRGGSAAPAVPSTTTTGAASSSFSSLAKAATSSDVIATLAAMHSYGSPNHTPSPPLAQPQPRPTTAHTRPDQFQQQQQQQQNPGFNMSSFSYMMPHHEPQQPTQSSLQHLAALHSSSALSSNHPFTQTPASSFSRNIAAPVGTPSVTASAMAVGGLVRIGSGSEEDDEFGEDEFGEDESRATGGGGGGGLKRRRLTAEERAQRSRERNRMHAKKTRQRKKVQIDAMTQRIDDLKTEFNELRSRLEERYTACLLLKCSGGGGSGDGGGDVAGGVAGSEMYCSATAALTAILGRDPDAEVDDLAGKECASLLEPCNLAMLDKTTGSGLDNGDGDGDEGDGPEADGSNGAIGGLNANGKRIRRRGKYSATERETIRRERNRMHAKRTRDRKKLFVEEAEATITRVGAESVMLRHFLQTHGMGGGEDDVPVPAPILALISSSGGSSNSGGESNGFSSNGNISNGNISSSNGCAGVDGCGGVGRGSALSHVTSMPSLPRRSGFAPPSHAHASSSVRVHHYHQQQQQQQHVPTHVPSSSNPSQSLNGNGGLSSVPPPTSVGLPSSSVYQHHLQQQQHQQQQQQHDYLTHPYNQQQSKYATPAEAMIVKQQLQQQQQRHLQQQQHLQHQHLQHQRQQQQQQQLQAAPQQQHQHPQQQAAVRMIEGGGNCAGALLSNPSPSFASSSLEGDGGGGEEGDDDNVGFNITSL